MKRGSILLSSLALALVLASCAAPVRPMGKEQPDLVVYNDSTAIIGSITVSSEKESQGVSMANGSPLERGESYGFEVADTDRVTVELWDLEQHSLGRCQVKMEEQPMRVTLNDDLGLWIQAEQEAE